MTPKIKMGHITTWIQNQFLKEIVILEADEVPAITPANWQVRTDKTALVTTAYLPSPIAIYVPDALYDSIIADSNWSQLPARGYYIKKLSTWQNIPALELDNVTITP